LLDNKNHTLSYFIDGKAFGVAFDDVEGNIYPMLTFFGEAASATLIKVGDHATVAAPTQDAIAEAIAADPEKCRLM